MPMSKQEQPRSGPNRDVASRSRSGSGTAARGLSRGKPQKQSGKGRSPSPSTKKKSDTSSSVADKRDSDSIKQQKLHEAGGQKNDNADMSHQLLTQKPNKQKCLDKDTDSMASGVVVRDRVSSPSAGEGLHGGSHEKGIDSELSTNAKMESDPFSGCGQVEQSESKKINSNRIMYSREQLLELKKLPLSQQRPAELTQELLNMLSTEPAKPAKYPATLSLRKEGNDTRSFPELTLSPHRLSFSGGCRFNKSKESTAGSDDQTNSPTTPRDTSDEAKVFDYSTPRNIPPPGSNSFTWTHHHHHSHRGGRDASSSYDEERNYSGLSSYSRYRSNSTSNNHNGKASSYSSDSYGDPEPEWMQFGPNCRTDFMELGGDEEIERMREEFKAKQKGNTRLRSHNSQQNSHKVDNISSPIGPIGPTGTEPAEEPSPDKVADDDVVANSNSEVELSHGRADEDISITDGLNVNDILRICDEDDVGGPPYQNGSQLQYLFNHSPMKMPSSQASEQPAASSSADPSSMLMHMLGVHRSDPGGLNNAPLVVGGKPANALTLDEVLAKENITVSPPTGASGNDEMGCREEPTAFQKLLAIVQPDGTAKGQMGNSVQQQSQLANQSSLIPPNSYAHLHHPPHPLPIGHNRQQPPTAMRFPFHPPPNMAHHYSEMASQSEWLGGPRFAPQGTQGGVAPIRPPSGDSYGQMDVRSQQQQLLEHQAQRNVQEQIRQQMMTNAHYQGHGVGPVGQPKFEQLMPTSVMRHMQANKQNRNMIDASASKVVKPAARLDQDLNQKAVSTHSSITGLMSQHGNAIGTKDHMIRPDHAHYHHMNYPLPPGHRPTRHYSPAQMVRGTVPSNYPMMGPPHPIRPIHYKGFPSDMPPGYGSYYNWPM